MLNFLMMKENKCKEETAKVELTQQKCLKVEKIIEQDNVFW